MPRQEARASLSAMVAVARGAGGAACTGRVRAPTAARTACPTRSGCRFQDHSLQQQTTEQGMTAIIQEDWKEQADEPEIRIDGRVDPEREDAHWQQAYWAEPYYR